VFHRAGADGRREILNVPVQLRREGLVYDPAVLERAYGAPLPRTALAPLTRGQIDGFNASARRPGDDPAGPCGPQPVQRGGYETRTQDERDLAASVEAEGKQGWEIQDAINALRRARVDVTHRSTGGNRQLVIGDQRWHLPANVSVTGIPARNTVGDRLQQLTREAAARWDPRQHLSQAERALIERTEEPWQRACLKTQARGLWVERQLRAASEAERMGLTWSSNRGLDAVDPRTGIQCDIMSGTRTNLNDHALREPDKMFRMITFWGGIEERGMPPITTVFAVSTNEQAALATAMSAPGDAADAAYVKYSKVEIGLSAFAWPIIERRLVYTPGAPLAFDEKEGIALAALSPDFVAWLRKTSPKEIRPIAYELAGREELDNMTSAEAAEAIGNLADFARSQPAGLALGEYSTF
jgi:hypothetical protein